MARISAWLALVTAAAIAGSLVLAGVLELGALGPVAAASLLVLGASRTLANKGVRVLCGAWGIALGLAWYAPSYNVPDFIPGMLAISAPVLVSAIGLALAALHREKV